MRASHDLRRGAVTPMALAAGLTIGALASLALLASAAAEPATAKPSLERVATLHAARAAHTATTLPSGLVLITGGMAGEGQLASAELFDPDDSSVRRLPPLAVRRAGHTATLLPDGRVLIAGGYDGDYHASIEIFDPAAGRFEPAGSLAVTRSEHTATLLPDGRVLFIGGVGHGWTFLASAEVYDPRTGRSESVGSMRLPRESHTATLLADGRVLVVGGHDGRRQRMTVHADAEVFAPATGRFEAAGTLGTARHKHDAVRLADGRVLVIGGADRTDRLHYATTELYDPRTATFAPGPTMSQRRYKIARTSVLLSGGQVLVSSGARAAELLDPATMRFREVPGRFPAAFRFAAVAPLSGGDVVVSGGYADGIRSTDGIWRVRR